MWSRRRFLAASAGALAASSLPLPSIPAVTPRPKRVALIATEVRKYSHAQHFVDRFLEGYGWGGRHHRPPVDLVSLYVDQFPEGDLSRERSKRFGVKIYPTISEALTRGGAKLDVDGVVVIGEHGSYPTNEKGQRLYPRYRFFRQVVDVFEHSGRAVPVFNDKHLSTDWRECVDMVKTSREMGFPFLAGSSLPVTWRIPSIDVPSGTPLEEAVCVCYGGVDSYDIHGLETSQCMAERRDGGESGVASVHAVRGDRVWKMLEERPTTSRLVRAALSRSHTLRAPDGFTFAAPSVELARRFCGAPIAYFIEHRDGFRSTLLLLNGLLQDFNFAAKVRGVERIISTQMYLPMPPRQTTLADFFNPQVHHIEEMIVTGKAPYPVQRTLLMSGVVIFAVESLYRGEVPLRTPELDVAYPAPSRSTYWRE